MARSLSSLVKEATVLLDSYSASRMCLDDFIEDTAQELQHRDPQQKKFLLDLVSGCAEHKKLLDVVVNVFYGQNGRWLSRGDRSQFVIVCYLTTFVLSDIGFQRYSTVIKSLDVKKTHTFLDFFFKHLTTWIQEEWNNIYDAAYVKEHWIIPLLNWRPDFDKLLDQMSVKISCGTRSKKTILNTTEPQEFSLTKPKPRPLPLPELIPLQEKHKPVPSSTYTAPKEIEVIQDLKKRNQQITAGLLHEANTKAFRCEAAQKADHAKSMQKAKAQVVDESDCKLHYRPFHSNKAPSNKINWPVNINKAAIQRQEALIHRRMKEEQQRLERLMAGEHEDTTFLKWRNVMRARDLQDEQDRLERQHLDGHISTEEAAKARKRIAEHNHRTVQMIKEEVNELIRKNDELERQEDKKLREMVHQIAEGRKNSKVAKDNVHRIKQMTVKEVLDQNRKLLRQAREEEEAELNRKFEIIQEMHNIESMPRFRVKNFNDTETAGHNLLGEMSQFEMMERLQILKEDNQVLVEEKRRRIREEKDRHKLLAAKTMEVNDLHARVLAKDRVTRKEEREKDRQIVRDLQQRIRGRLVELKERKEADRRREEAESSKSSDASARLLKEKEQNWEDTMQRLQQLADRTLTTRM